MANDSLRGRQVVVQLTNESGGGVVEGDVVIIDDADSKSFKTTSDEGLSTHLIGVALETIANNALGRVCFGGYVPQINLDGAASLEDYVEIDGVAKQGTPLGSIEEGAFAQVLETGTTPAAIIFNPPAQAGAGGGFYEAYMKCSDVKAQNTAGGTFTLGAWRTRDINTEDSDTGGNMSIGSNQITLDAGTYRTLISCPARVVTFHQTRLYNISDTAVELIGTSERTSSGAEQTRSFIVGRFTIASQKIFEVQHQSTATRATDGFGSACNFTSEVYTIAEFWKEA